MDNLLLHNVGGVQQAIRAAGAELFCLPPHSPNPIEMALSKLKARLQKAAEHTNSRPAAAGQVALLKPSVPESAGISSAMPAMFKHDRNPFCVHNLCESSSESHSEITLEEAFARHLAPDEA